MTLGAFQLAYDGDHRYPAPTDRLPAPKRPSEQPLRARRWRGAAPQAESELSTHGARPDDKATEGLAAADAGPRDAEQKEHHRGVPDAASRTACPGLDRRARRRRAGAA